MAQTNLQYLRISIDGVNYLLPSDASVATEERTNLSPGSGTGVRAWRESGIGRWAAYELDGQLRPSARGVWQRAVFVHGLPEPVGLVADEIQMISPSEELTVVPFRPMGRPPAQSGHLFNGFRVDRGREMFVFDAGVLGTYLKSMGVA